MEVWQSCPVWSNQLTLPCWNQPYQQGLERKRCIIWSLKGTKSKPAALKSSGCGMPASPIKPQTTASWLPRSTMPRPSSVTSHLSKMHNIQAKMYHLFSLLSSARTICWGRARRLLMAPTTFWCSQPHLKQKIIWFSVHLQQSLSPFSQLGTCDRKPWLQCCKHLRSKMWREKESPQSGFNGMSWILMGISCGDLLLQAVLCRSHCWSHSAT